ncbi:MAG TPA: amidohydrolase family protein [Actinomycetes bacterium]|nr:amidohydrolase family protein [Actinomycetes bacterium]
MTVVDAHHHLWDPGTRDYPWMAGPALAPIRRPFTLDDLRREATAAGVTRTVLVQAVADLGETEELLALAAASEGLVAGVVGWVDLTADDVAGILDRLRAGPAGDRLVGVRHQVQDEDDPAWLARADVGRGLRAVAAAGLAYDLLVLVPQLPAARAVVAGLPDARFVLDHAAKPAIAEGALEPWAGELAALARLPNVACKLSGLVTEARWDDWDADRIRPYADHVLTVFGPDRVMFGSDWPVCRLAASYGEVRELAEDLLAGLSPAERDAVFRRTAAGTYRLAP